MSPKYVIKEETDLSGNPQVVVRRGMTASDVGNGLGTLIGLATIAHRSGKQQQFTNIINKISDYFDKGDYTNAATQADEMLKFNTAESRLVAHLVKAQCYFENEDFAKAASEFTATLEVANTHDISEWTNSSVGDMSPEAWVVARRGLCYFYDQKWGPAITDFKKCSQLTPNEPGSYLYLAKCLKKLDDPEQALTYLNRLVELAPGEESSYIERGRVFVDMHEYEKAIADFSRAIKLTPQEPEAYELRSKAYLALGNDEKSKDDLQKISLLKTAKQIPLLDELISALRVKEESLEITQMLTQTEIEWEEQERAHQQTLAPFEKWSNLLVFGAIASILVANVAMWLNLLDESMLMALFVGIPVPILFVVVILNTVPRKVPKRYLEIKEQRSKLNTRQAELNSKPIDTNRVEQLYQIFGGDLSLDDLMEMRNTLIRQVKDL